MLEMQDTEAASSWGIIFEARKWSATHLYSGWSV
jgi:hypothetical protein